jgi:hypothetical protein
MAQNQDSTCTYLALIHLILESRCSIEFRCSAILPRPATLKNARPCHCTDTLSDRKINVIPLCFKKLHQLSLAGRGFHAASLNRAFSSNDLRSELSTGSEIQVSSRQDSPDIITRHSYQVAAGEILRHSNTGAGILHRGLQNIPANETTLFLHLEILTHLVF